MTSPIILDEDIITPLPTPELVFITGCLKVAGNTVGDIRAKVISEAAQVLGCEPSALDFLFSDQALNNADTDVYDFPDAARRRFVIETAHLAAE